MDFGMKKIKLGIRFSILVAGIINGNYPSVVY